MGCIHKSKDGILHNSISLLQFSLKSHKGNFISKRMPLRMFSSLSSKSLPHLTFLSHLFQWLSLLINYLTKCIAISATFTTRVQNAAVFQTLRDDQITVIIPGKQKIHIHIFFPLGTRRCGTTKSYKFFLPSFLLPSLPPSFLFFLASFSQFQFRCLIAPTKLQAPWRLGLLSALFTIGTKTNKPSKILGISWASKAGPGLC